MISQRIPLTIKPYQTKECAEQRIDKTFSPQGRALSDYNLGRVCESNPIQPSTKRDGPMILMPRVFSDEHKWFQELLPMF